MAQIHRFHDTVAVHLGGGETIYLTPKAAREVADAINHCASDIGDCKFTDSNFPSTTIDVE